LENVTISLNKYELAFVYSLLKERKDNNNVILDHLQSVIHNLILKNYLADDENISSNNNEDI